MTVPLHLRLSPSQSATILAIVETELGGFERVDAVLLHGEALPAGAGADREIGLAILVTTDPSDWPALWRIEARLDAAFADRSWTFEVSVWRAADARAFERCQNQAPARLRRTGLPLHPASDPGRSEALPYAEALAGTAAHFEWQAANWLTQPYRRPCDAGEICAFAYRAACHCVKVPLVRADWPVWPPALRWRLDRLLQLAAWLDPAVAGWADDPALLGALPAAYFVPDRVRVTQGWPRRTEKEARTALAAAWRIGRRIAPGAIRAARELLRSTPR